MPEERVLQLLRETIRVAKDHSVLTYRNLLVPRSRPETLSDRIIPETEMADRLYETDRSFIYRKYVVEQINKNHGLHCQEYIG